jgi:long-chain acyl-CoA synthetase
VEKGDPVGIFSQNSQRWVLSDYASLMLRCPTIPIYATNTAAQAAYIVNDAGIKVLFVGDSDQYERILSLWNELNDLQLVVLLDPAIEKKNDRTITLEELMERGSDATLKEKLESIRSESDPDSLATIIYTSGTTGNPKGVMLTHGNFFHQFRAVDAYFTVKPEDRSLCFLPLSHVYERTWSYYAFQRGTTNHYFSDPKQVVEYLQEVRPTVMVSVPRLYEKVYSTVTSQLESASGVKKGLFSWAVKTGLKYQLKSRRGAFTGPFLSLSYSLADRLVLSKIRNAVGGPKNFFSAGGAPLSREIEEFFLAADLLICQGYGLTETSPMVSFNTPPAFKFGTVGKPVPEVEVRITDEGEITVKGPNVMMGYHNRPDETAEVLRDGWFHTGDVGFIDDDGYLVITDRIKDLIITAGGKNIAPQNIETEVGKDHYIEQMAVIGDRRPYVVALIVPSFPSLEEYAAKQGIEFSNREELVNHPDIQAFYQSRIDKSKDKLARFEQIKRFTLIPNEFTQEGGELTPTLKIKRKNVQEKYGDLIEKMYEGSGE